MLAMSICEVAEVAGMPRVHTERQPIASKPSSSLATFSLLGAKIRVERREQPGDDTEGT